MGRSVIAVLLLLVLAAPLVPGQVPRTDYQAAEEDADAVLAPIHTIVASAPRVVEDGIAEADFDGTPDRAAALLAAMRGFVAGLEDAPRWPNGSQAAQAQLRGYAFAVGVTNLLQDFPRELGTLARDRAGCHSWQANATAAEWDRWMGRSTPAYARLSIIEQDLADAARGAPDGVSGAPLSRAATSLGAWLDEGIPDFQACMDQFAAVLKITPDLPEFFLLDVVPDTTWPTGTALVTGTIGPVPQAPLAIESVTLGLDAPLATTDRGGFSLTITVPVDAPPGTHTITVTAPDGRTATTALTIERVPVRLELSHPPSVAPGQETTMRVRVVAPLAVADRVGAGPVTLTGDLSGNVTLTQAAASHSFIAPPSPTTLEGDATYAGNQVLQEANATYLITVAEPAAQGGAGGAIHLFPDLDLVELAIGVAALLVATALGLAAWRMLRARSRRRLTRLLTAERRPDPYADEKFTVHPQSLVIGFSNLRQSLKRRGVAGPGTTARELGSFLALYGTRPVHAIELFERARYGEWEEKPQARVAGTRWALSFWHRLKRGPPRRRPRRRR